MPTIWILWAVLTLIHPTAQAVVPVDEFTSTADCAVALKILGHELAAMEPENLKGITLTCIPVGMRD